MEDTNFMNLMSKSIKNSDVNNKAFFNKFYIDYPRGSVFENIETTGIIIDDNSHFILKGNHLEKLVALATYSGIEAVLDYYLDHFNERSSYDWASHFTENYIHAKYKLYSVLNDKSYYLKFMNRLLSHYPSFDCLVDEKMTLILNYLFYIKVNYSLDVTINKIKEIFKLDKEESNIILTKMLNEVYVVYTKNNKYISLTDKGSIYLENSVYNR